MTPEPVTLAESFARMAERIRELEAVILELRQEHAAAHLEIFDLLRENERLRQEIDEVTDRERDAHRWEGSR
jgi:regulator of replication initiation timing